ncbi:MAG: prepilin-type N-terminal cleavage/methylation domain-containing protein [bacterium]|nr:prepilin-type N-terminal cleavage/methylation domain-containing protein [bacterium]
MNCKHPNRGFTLIEVIIAVALVAIMAVTVAPPLVQNIKMGKVTRAQSDAQTIGNAVLTFYKDVGEWPVVMPDGRYAYKLLGNASMGGGNSGVPRGTNTIAGSGSWDDNGRSMTLTDVLIRNSSSSVAEFYKTSNKPQETPGWNGPYLSKVPTDPWGNPYAVNIRWSRSAIAGSNTADYDKHNLLVVSAGPNKIFETSLSANVENEQLGGDDVGFIFQPASRY